MAEQTIEMTFRTILWQQFGAAIDMLENALLACPASLWRECLWSAPSDHLFVARHSRTREMPSRHI
ncbi:hypothetical protein KSC_098340 [Ktedonobacter sp. SOSP1-52]|uniref:hypothetical protein n=1 Tax=Ktedonobacter sp. SOSP1-52 TaxID=2778366 RepID=UPI001A2846A2|nr:hypothetical protein [Ktedonobacter sp. SOSP1-52]GHO70942.1 hypothetical protein KSC_098340 [Ktedonobacter sp. SOSP1-52]